jgi:phenylpropionate dioxygenase-like ring-hydroxylating dioxygenase large terminal subunit
LNAPSVIPIQPVSTGPLPSGFLPRNCTFAPGDWAILSTHWFPVARAADVQSAPVAVTLLDLELVVYRTPAGLRVARDLCPHRGVPLSMGSVEGDELVCAYHGLRFGPDGQCRKIPAQPDLKPSARFRMSMFPAVERYGLVWTCLAPDGRVAIPPMPSWDDSGYQAILPPPVDIAGSPGRQLEGFVDVAHFAFVHHEAFADRDNPVVPAYETEFTEFGLRSDYWSNVSNYPKALQHLAPPEFRWLRRYEIHPPFTAQLTVHFPEEGRLHILNAASPVSARKTRLFVPIARNFDKTGSLEDVYAFNAQVFAEDQAIVERQRPEELPLDMQAEAHFAADRTSSGYRRLLREMKLTMALAG